MRRVPKASLLVYGPCSNAGDVLIHKTIEKLFEGEIDFRYHHIRNDKLEHVEDNIVIGPGGILSGSYTPEKKPDEWLIRHLTQSRVDEWSKKGKNVTFFGTGTNTPLNPNKNQKPFSLNSEKIVSDLISMSSGAFVRGNYDRMRLQTICQSEDVSKLSFQPCPSVFIDTMVASKRDKLDKIAVNFPFLKSITSENVDKHPIKRFITYARSLGLDCVFSPNHTQDINPYVFDLFDEVDVSEGLANFICSSEFDYTQGQVKMQDEWEGIDCIFSRFSGYRFAFGARLHSFLPFMAFETPSLFLTGNVARMPMPIDYFNNPVYLAKNGFHPDINKMEEVVDGMIERLNYFIKNEASLVSEIRREKERLWEVTELNKIRLLSNLS
ncbi:polysaccharide pyruvyl transferase family protein [Psychrobacter sp. AOP7-C1-14]|uniref:polysaccharide pyruvyl transferase family protein n=1 Tax=Psychrobacter sp. AOP7-C1-14 TaxID=3457640 RepID=UPI00402B10D9